MSASEIFMLCKNLFETYGQPPLDARFSHNLRQGWTIRGVSTRQYISVTQQYITGRMIFIIHRPIMHKGREPKILVVPADQAPYFVHTLHHDCRYKARGRDVYMYTKAVQSMFPSAPPGTFWYYHDNRGPILVVVDESNDQPDGATASLYIHATNTQKHPRSIPRYFAKRLAHTRFWAPVQKKEMTNITPEIKKHDDQHDGLWCIRDMSGRTQGFICHGHALPLDPGHYIPLTPTPTRQTTALLGIQDEDVHKLTYTTNVCVDLQGILFPH